MNHDSSTSSDSDNFDPNPVDRADQLFRYLAGGMSATKRLKAGSSLSGSSSRARLAVEVESVLAEWANDESRKDVDDADLPDLYRLESATPCDGKCGKNNQDNLCCICGLGEKKWKQAALVDLESAKGRKAIEAACCDFPQKRAHDCPVGLINLGATCYVNSLLQMWYANLTIRDRVFKYKLPAECGEPSSNQRAVLELQRVFGCLALLEKQAHNPVKFIDQLKLSHTVQQDGEEFCRLFMTILDEELGGKIVHTEYGGKYCHETTCETCQNTSYRDSVFFDLELPSKDRKDLKECLDSYFQTERLEGANAYECEKCGAKRNATRRAVLTELPRVLWLHVLRFDFNYQTGQKKKIKDLLRFPEVLDMTDYCRQQPRASKGGRVKGNSESSMYELCAVLIHRGPSASSGHYAAQVLGDDNVWWEMDDESVVPIKAGKGRKHVVLGELESESLYGEGKKAKAPPVGSHQSRNAYVLTYRRKGSTPNIDVAIPDEIRAEIEAENAQFRAETAQAEAIAREKIEEDRKTAVEICKMYDALHVKTLPGDGDVAEVAMCKGMTWVPTPYLKAWLKTIFVDSVPQYPAPVYDNILCSHGRLDIAATHLCKLVNRKPYEELLAKVVPETRPPANLTLHKSLCKDCGSDAYSRASRSTRFARMTAGVIQISGCNQRKFEGEKSGYWVSRSALRELVKRKTPPDESAPLFNAEAQCKHSRRVYNEEKVVCLHEEVWLLIADFFDNKVVALKSGTPEGTPCDECVQEATEEASRHKKVKGVADKEKQELKHLVLGHSDVAIDDLVHGKVAEEVFAVPTSFMDDWRKWCKQRSKGSPQPTNIPLRQLLCDCEKQLLRVDFNWAAANPADAKELPRATLLKKGDWQALIQRYPVQVEKMNAVNLKQITVRAEPPEEAMEEAGSRIVTDPVTCQECFDEAVKRILSAAVFTNAPVWVKCRTRATFSEHDSDAAIAAAMANTQTSVHSRRARRRKGSKKVQVSSTDTLAMFRVSIMNIFQVMPLDQHIFVRGRELTKDMADQTLGSLGLRPDDEIDLEIDRSIRIEEIEESPSGVEHGFSGTMLVTSSLPRGTKRSASEDTHECIDLTGPVEDGKDFEMNVETAEAMAVDPRIELVEDEVESMCHPSLVEVVGEEDGTDIEETPPSPSVTRTKRRKTKKSK